MTRVAISQPIISFRAFQYPGGVVIGAAWSADSSIAIIEQAKIEDELTIPHTSSVTLATVDKTSLRPIHTRRYEARPLVQSRFPCGTIYAAQDARQIYVCSADTFIEVLDLGSLQTIRTIFLDKIYSFALSFAVDEAHNEIFVVASTADGSLAIEVINTQTDRIQLIPLQSVLPLSAYMTIDLSSHRIAIFSPMSSDATDIYACDYKNEMVCRRTVYKNYVDQGFFVHSELLFVPSDAGFSKRNCILSLDWETGKTASGYCDKQSGVHFSGTLVTPDFVIAFTGKNHPRIFSEVVDTLSSSVTVWDVLTKKRLTTKCLPVSFTSYGSHATLVGSHAGLFLAFQARSSNELLVGSVIDK